MQKGNIGVTTENIFPVIKKFLYSDHEIFIREIVSNAVDATQKLKTLANKGDFMGETGELKVCVKRYHHGERPGTGYDRRRNRQVHQPNRVLRRQ